jgi:hypothetical protein
MLRARKINCGKVNRHERLMSIFNKLICCKAQLTPMYIVLMATAAAISLLTIQLQTIVMYKMFEYNNTVLVEH